MNINKFTIEMVRNIHSECYNCVNAVTPPPTKSGETTSHTTPCPRVDLMNGRVNITKDNIDTSSNIIEKSNLISGDKPWSSSADDLEPSIIIQLSDNENVTITDVKLIKPVNIAAFKVAILDRNQTTVYNMVGNLHINSLKDITSKVNIQNKSNRPFRNTNILCC